MKFNVSTGKRILRFIGLLITAFVFMSQTLWHWFIPSYVNRQIVQAIRDVWDGDAEIKSIDLNLFSPTIISGIKITDSSGRTWINLKRLELSFSDWPGIAPKLTEIKASGLVLTMHFKNGSPDCTLKSSSASSPGSVSRYIDIRKISLDDLSLIGRDNHGGEIRFNQLDGVITKNNGEYLFNLNDPSKGNLLADTSFEPDTLALESRISADQTLNPPEVNFFRHIFGLSLTGNLKGTVSSKIFLAGGLKPEDTLSAYGRIKLSDWNGTIYKNISFSHLNTDIFLKGDDVEFDNLTAESCQGTISADILYQNLPDNTDILNGKISVRDVSLPDLFGKIGVQEKISQGKMNLDYNFSLPENDLNQLSAVGMLFMDDVESFRLPVIKWLLDNPKINPGRTAASSDLAAVFSMSGPVVTLKQAQLSNKISALNAEPGGTINLQTTGMNFYVVGVPLSSVRKMMLSLPLVNHLVRLRDSLTRLHISGSWNDPPTKLLITKPLKDGEADMYRFLKEIKHTGGQFSRETLLRFDELFRLPEKSAK
jgi:hypothetical protein